MTLVRAVVAKALRGAAAFNAGAKSAPAAVLWADPERTWELVIRNLQEVVPILVLGAYDPKELRGRRSGCDPCSPHPSRSNFRGTSHIVMGLTRG